MQSNNKKILFQAVVKPEPTPVVEINTYSFVVCFVKL